MSFRGVIGDVVQTGRGASGVFSFEWRIPNFPSLTGEGGDRHVSPYFEACGGADWCFQIYPNGLSRVPPSESVSLFVFRADAGTPKKLSLTLGIRGPQGEAGNKKERIHEFSSDDNVCFWCNFCSRSELKSRLMAKKVLVISLDMKMNVLGDSFTQTAKEDTEDETSGKQGIGKLSEDIGRLLANGEDSDVTVHVDDVDFKVHRAILSARSPVFSAMFRHETEERASNNIKINDCEPDVFGDFLGYLYTGSTRSFAEQNVFELYRVADKYLADDLKQQCLEHIRSTLSVRTFCDAARLALMHGESSLMERVTVFAAENIRTIVRTAEWLNFSGDHAMEANEILVSALDPPN